MIEISSGCRPDQGNNTFRNHGTEEDRPAVFLILDTTRHQRALCRMETGDSPAGDTHEHDREDRQMAGIGIRHSVRNLGQRRMMDKQHDQDTDRHKQQSTCKQRIDLADNLIDRQ